MRTTGGAPCCEHLLEEPRFPSPMTVYPRDNADDGDEEDEEDDGGDDGGGAGLFLGPVAQFADIDPQQPVARVADLLPTPTPTPTPIAPSNSPSASSSTSLTVAFGGIGSSHTAQTKA